MPGVKRAKSTTRVKKVSAPPVIIDLLDSDEDELLTQAIQASMQDQSPEMKMDDDFEPDFASQDSNGSAKVARENSQLNGHSSTTGPLQPPLTIPMRRSATLPICQVHSKSTTPLNSRNNSELSSAALDSLPEGLDDDAPLPKASSTPNIGRLDDLDSEDGSQMGFKKRASKPVSSNTSRTSTPPIMDSRSNSKTAISSSIPSTTSKLPPSSSSSSSELPRMKSSSSSLFRARDSIDAHLIKSQSIEDVEEELSKGKRSLSSGRLSIDNMINGMEDMDDDDEEALSVFNPPPKKRGRPTGSTNAKHKFQPNSPPSKTNSSSSDIKSSSTSSSKTSNMAEQPATATSTAKAGASSTTKKVSPPVKRTTSNPDLLLEEILGPNVSKALASTTPSWDPYRMRDTMMAEAVNHSLNIVRRALDDVGNQKRSPTPSAPATTSTNAQQISIIIKAGKRDIPMIVHPSNLISSCLNKLTSGDQPQLPMLLSNETYLLKFDGIALDPSSTFAENHVGSKDAITVFVLKNGQEVPFSTTADFEDENGEGGAAAFEEETGNKIVITVKFPDGKTQAKFRIHRDKPLSTLAEAAAEKLKIDPSTVRLKFDGDLLPLHKSAEDLDEPLEDEDMVDLVVKN